MGLNLISIVGEMNPQLFRELKGKLKPRNIAIATAITALGQLVLLFSYFGRLPLIHEQSNRYCTGGNPQYYYREFNCLKDSFGQVLVNWQLWWTDVFVWLSIITIFTLMTVGVYQLISDLDREERKGTLNFIRLSPESTQNLLVGKLLGVPILLYWVSLLAIPLHLWAGVSAGIPFIEIAGLYAFTLAVCACFYSGAILFALASTWMGGFQSWLGAGIVFLFGMFTSATYIYGMPTDAFKLLSPVSLIPYLVPQEFYDTIDILGYNVSTLISHSNQWEWFGIGLGKTGINVAFFAVLNAALWTAWIWLAILRCFRNANTTAISKVQSYWLAGCFQILLLGFSLHPQNWSKDFYGHNTNLYGMLMFDLGLFLCLMAALLPERQTCVDWSRYRHLQSRKYRKNLFLDLILGEKSPAIEAIAINLMITHGMLVPWVLSWYVGDAEIAQTNEVKGLALLSIILSASLILLFSAISQLLLMMKTPKRGLWAIGTVSASISLPPLVLLALGITSEKIPGLWMFTLFPWEALKSAPTTIVFLSLLAQWGGFVLVNLQLKRQLRLAGESASQALLKGTV